MNDIKDIWTMDELLKYCQYYRIKLVPKSEKFMCGFAGMHMEKGEDWGVNIPPNTIFYDGSMKGKELFETLKHEVEELVLMRIRGIKYFPAHRIATSDEKKH